MRKHILALLCVIGFSTCGVRSPHVYAQQQTQDAAPVEAPSPVKVTLSVFPPDKYTSKNFPVRVTFENTSDKDLTLLRIFDPIEVFFWFRIKKPDGNRIPTPIMATADFRRSDLRYLTLKSGETFGTTLNLAETLSESVNPNQPLLAGNYEIGATYSNGYGDDCFKGMAEPSEPIKLHLSKDISFPAPAN